MDVLRHDVIVIGGGLAGLRCAVELADAGRDVALLTKVHPLRSHSVAAQGGINAALGNAPDGRDDTWERHAFDTVKGSDFLADQDAVLTMCREAPAAVYELEHWGTVFSRFADGRIAQRPFGGAGFPRTCYAADRTGHNLLHTLYEQAVKRGLVVYEEFFVSALATGAGRCVGCVALDIRTGALQGFAARAVVLATGGYGRLYARSTNALINTGDGAALALRAGCPLEDMEFVQFHPTTLFGTSILISEGARGEGGYLRNSRGERFMSRYAEHAMELAPRDIVARSIQTEIDEGRGFENEYVHLDLTHIDPKRVKERLPGIRQIAMDFSGVDPVERPIPVQPGQHYSMGGVASDAEGATPVPGLYAVGECACVSVHGANRLGGNSLLDTVVFGRRCGRRLASALPEPPQSGPVVEKVKEEKARIGLLLGGRKVESPVAVREALRETMFACFGIFRKEAIMREGLARVSSLQERGRQLGLDARESSFSYALVSVLELQSLLDIAPSVAVGAIKRQESRGAHFRPDFTNRDDARFLRHSITQLGPAGIELSYVDVRTGSFPVEERKY